MRVAALILPLAFSVLLTSCAQVIMIGPHKDAISYEDIQQIKRAVWQEREMRSTALFIQPLGHDAAACQSGSAAINAGHYYTFVIRRINSKWIIDDSNRLTHARIVVY